MGCVEEYSGGYVERLVLRRVSLKLKRKVRNRLLTAVAVTCFLIGLLTGVGVENLLATPCGTFEMGKAANEVLGTPTVIVEYGECLHIGGAAIPIVVVSAIFGLVSLVMGLLAGSLATQVEEDPPV